MLFVKFILAMIPIIWLIIALSVLKIAGHKACLIALAITAVLSVGYWKLSVINTVTGALEGVLNALWPICLVIIAALFTYNLTLKTGAMDKIKQMLAGVSTDKRILLLIIGWGFGNFMEGMAGFGTAVAIPASMLVGIGLDPLGAVLACFCANTTPTAFGSVGVPTTTLATVTNLDVLSLSGDVATIQVILTLITPFIMVMIIGKGLKALKGMIPFTLVASLSYVIPWFFAAHVIGCELPDIIGSIISLAAMVFAAKLLGPKGDNEYSIKIEQKEGAGLTVNEGIIAWSPFILIFILLMITSKLCPPIQNAIAGIKTNVIVYADKEVGATLGFSWINTPGVMIFIAAIIGGLIQKASFAEMGSVLVSTLKTYWKTIVTICSVVAVAKVMGYSGMTQDIANFLVAVTGPLHIYPLISPLIGGIGAFVTGSGTSTCVLFGPLQASTAAQLGLSPSWIAAANVMGAGIGKMICPQGIAIGAGAINMVGQESKILSAVFKYFIIYIALAGIICFAGAIMGFGA